MVANDLDWKKIYELLAVSDLRKVLFDKLITGNDQIATAESLGKATNSEDIVWRQTRPEKFGTGELDPG